MLTRHCRYHILWWWWDDAGSRIASHKVRTQYVHLKSHPVYFLLPWITPQDISRRSMLFHNWREYLLYQTYVHTTFYHGSGLTWNWMFNRSICYVLFLHILRFYFVGQIWCRVFIHLNAGVYGDSYDLFFWFCNYFSVWLRLV